MSAKIQNFLYLCSMIDEIQQKKDERYMQMALDEAHEALKAGEIPIGAVVVCKDRVISRAHNLTETLCDVNRSCIRTRGTAESRRESDECWLNLVHTSLIFCCSLLTASAPSSPRALGCSGALNIMPIAMTMSAGT